VTKPVKGLKGTTKPRFGDKVGKLENSKKKRRKKKKKEKKLPRASFFRTGATYRVPKSMLRNSRVSNQ
jgi:hypothetical protein